MVKVGILREGEKGVCVSKCESVRECECVCVHARVGAPIWTGYKGTFLFCLPFVYINDLVAGLPENFHSV